jgi:hypothetical protein
MANSVKRSEKGKKGYLRYKQEGRRERNRERRLRRQLKQYPNDLSNPLHPKHRKEYQGPKAEVVADGV